MGKIKDYFYRVEFQQRGSLHVHMLIWVENAPIFEVDSVEDITTFIDRHTTCAKNEQISQLVNYQTHRHAPTCKKKGKIYAGLISLAPYAKDNNTIAA